MSTRTISTGAPSFPTLIPQLSREIFPDATPQQMRFLKVMVDYMRESDKRVRALEKAVGLAGEPKIARKGEPGIFANSLIHVDEAGIAWLAVNSDPSRQATDVVASVAMDQVLCVPSGLAKVRCLPFASTSPTLYLSSRPGFAVDVEPIVAGISYVQIIGNKKSSLNQFNGSCVVEFAPQIPGDGHGSDKDIDGGTFVERERLIQVRRGTDPTVATMAVGELGFDSLFKRLFVGDGATVGGKVVGIHNQTFFISGIPGVQQVGRV